MRIESTENIQRLRKYMTGRLTGLGHGGLKIEFSSDNNNYARNCIESQSCFDQLIFHAFGDLLPEISASHNEFRTNLNFYYDNGSHSIS